MTQKVSCQCGVVMVVPNDRAGTRVGCPKCGAEVRIPLTAGVAHESPTPESVAANEEWETIEPPPLPKKSRVKPSPSPPPLPREGATNARSKDAEPEQAPPRSTPPKPAASDQKRTKDKKKRWTEPDHIGASQQWASPPALPAHSSPTDPLAADTDFDGEIDGAVPTPLPELLDEELFASQPALPDLPTPESSESNAPAVPAPEAATPTLESDPVQPPPLPEQPLPGLDPSPEGRRSALFLAAAVALIGLFSGTPAIAYLIQHVPLGTLAFPRWAAGLLLLSGLHVAYAFYVAQLPDWSTVWVVAITMLGVATLNSLMLASTLLGQQDGALVRLLELHDYIRGGRAAGWCFIMLCLSITVAYCAGRMASRWHAAESARAEALHVSD